MTNPDFLNFHDEYLTSVAVADKCATLGFTRSDGSQYELVLDGVEALQIDDFRQGNIVYALEVITCCDPRNYDNDLPLDRLFPSPHPNAAPHYHEAHASFMAKRIERIVNREATLVTVSSSYGADLVAYCANISLLGPMQGAVA